MLWPAGWVGLRVVSGQEHRGTLVEICVVLEIFLNSCYMISKMERLEVVIFLSFYMGVSLSRIPHVF